MRWVRVWQEWAYIQLITSGESDNLSSNQMTEPGKIDNSDILAAPNKSLLTDNTKGFEW